MAAKAKRKKKEIAVEETAIVEGPKKPELPDMQPFKMVRNEDENGISGTGIVAHGVVWPDGHVDLQWISEHPSEIRWNKFEDFKRIHIDSHPGNKTEIVWYDIRKRPVKNKE